RVVELDVSVPEVPRPLRVRVPNRADVMAEPVAGAADTTFAVKRRFGRVARGIRMLSFDHGGQGFRSGRIAGLTEGATGGVVLSPNLALADEVEEHRRRRASEPGPVRPSAGVPPPWTALDGVTAHELWHQLDAAIGASGARYIELNRELGAEL